VFVEDRRLAGRDEFVFGHDRAGGGFHDQQRPTVDNDGHTGPD
jgi:hypothetical protein